MLRAAVLLLLAANLALFAWTQGWLGADWPVPRDGEREPERLAAQVAPDAVRVVSPQDAVASIAAAAAASVSGAVETSCLETAPLDASTAVGAASALAAAGFGTERWERVASPAGAGLSALRIATTDADDRSRLAALPGLAFSPCAAR